MRTVRDKVLVQPDIERTLGSFAIPERYHALSGQGVVRAVGPGSTPEGTVIPMEVKVGDRVLYDKKNAIEVDIEGNRHIVVSEKHVFAVFE